MGRIILIAAAGENNEIGKDNDLMWRLPDDFKRFKALTSGHDIIMGRKTFESLPEPLKNRRHIIISRKPDYRITHQACKLVNSLDEALEVAGPGDVYVIGGGEIYSQSMERADCIELTRVHGSFEGADTFFPPIDLSQWQVVAEDYHPADERHRYAFTYLTYSRKQV